MVVSGWAARADNQRVPPFLPEIVLGALVLGGMVADQLRRSAAGSPRPAVVPVESRPPRPRRPPTR
jgi:hypothetical protein